MALCLDGVSKIYGDVEVLRPISLKVPDGEFLTVLGPSGSGKTTILKLIGGFITPTHGRILLDGKDLSKTHISERPFNTVFQDYALFPHMTVEQNIGYGLMVKRCPKEKMKRIVNEALDVVGLSEYPSRYPAELSGGQKQRVALARAIVCEPQIVLLDEPLSALDAELRRQMQYFLKSLQRKMGTTFLFVTHDQQEAISISDRLVVMNDGGVEQVGTPKEIYYSPKTKFVAGFFGDNNLLDGRLTNSGSIDTPLGKMPLRQGSDLKTSKVMVAMRPELFQIGKREGAFNIDCQVQDIDFAGDMNFLRLTTKFNTNHKFLVKLPSNPQASDVKINGDVTISIKIDDIAQLDNSE